MSDHVDELELYALGVLEPEERQAIDAHLATCAECSQRVGQAERVVAALEPGMFDVATVPATRVRRFPVFAASSGWLAAAAAVAFAVGLGTSGDHARLATVLSNDDTIAHALVHSHFLHAAFVPAMETAPSAKVLYGRDGSWLYVVVDGARPGLHVTCRMPKSATRVDLGQPQPRGATSELFAHPPQRPGSIDLRDDSGEVLASVNLTYPATP